MARRLDVYTPSAEPVVETQRQAWLNRSAARAFAAALSAMLIATLVVSSNYPG
ncbi:MAG: hypothetical protein F6J94_10095 [Moorea sp. SIO1F2]|nr:hypothetical protein [Moorena sp. SIO1F2]